MNPLTTVRGALTTGFVASHRVGAADRAYHASMNCGLARWLHIVTGITWIGLLYYFNLVQIPGLAAAARTRAARAARASRKYIAPTALFWFRWAAAATWFTGVWYLARSGNLVGAFALGMRSDPVNSTSSSSASAPGSAPSCCSTSGC